MFIKYAFLFWFGGATYVALEVIWRGYSHWTMLVLAGVLFIAIGLLNELWTWATSLLVQVGVAAALATFSELVTGLVVNRWLGWNVWDYSDMPFNFMGQICPQFTLVWVAISLLAIVLDDVIRWKFFGEDRPHYTLLKE